jgi:hypothetical protein
VSTLLVQIIFGWPAIIASLLVATAGLVGKRWWALLISAALFFPPSLYLRGYPPFWGLSFLVPFLLLGAAFTIRARKTVLAWLLASPVFIVSAWLAVLVITQ